MKCAIAVLCVSRLATADILNNEGIHAHVDAEIAAGVTPGLASHLTVSLEGLVPILGTYELDEKVFGDPRPSGIIFDWVLGGIAPVALGIAALATHGQARKWLAWTALGLYTGTRIAVLTIGNLHVSEYNRYVGVKLGAARAPSGRLVPALVVSVLW